MNYANHSKFAYKNFDEIQDCINTGELDIYDVVYTKDTHENIIIAPDYSIISVKSKIYRFTDVPSAETFLNSAEDTYEGQIVSVIAGGKYSAYIVNKNKEGSFYISPLVSDEGSVSDYDFLTNRPITNLTGQLGTPVKVAELKTGLYRITGQYQISDSLPTVFMSLESNLFLVEHSDSVVYIKKISARDITDYKVDDELTTISTVPTTEWLKEQGYATESYVDAKIAALDFITKQEVEQYVISVVEAIVEQKVSERLRVATEEEAREVFNQIFKEEE